MKTNLDPITALFEASRSMTSAIRILRGTELHQEKGDTIFDRVNEAIAYLGNRRDVADAAARSIAPRKSDADLIVELRAELDNLKNINLSRESALHKTHLRAAKSELENFHLKSELGEEFIRRIISEALIPSNSKSQTDKLDPENLTPSDDSSKTKI